MNTLTKQLQIFLEKNKDKEVTPSAVARVLDVPVPPNRQMEFDCPIHGHRLFTTYMRNDGTWRDPYCDECASIAARRQEIITDIQKDVKELHKDLRNILELETPPLWFDASFDSFVTETREQAEVLRRCKKFADEFLDREVQREFARRRGQKNYCTINRWGIGLQGNYGTGKTHLAIAIAKRTMELGIPALYLRAMDLFPVLASCERDVSVNAVMAKLCRIPCLILDELGRHSWTDFQKNLLFRLIDSRMNNGRPMIVITNLNFGELTQLVDGAVIDRFKQTIVGMAFPWESQRGRFSKFDGGF